MEVDKEAEKSFKSIKKIEEHPCIILKRGWFAKVIDIFSWFAVWTALVLTPLNLVFPEVRKISWLADVHMISDILCCVVILTNFCRQKTRTMDHKEIARRYMIAPPAFFWMDILSVIPLFKL